MEHPCKLQQRGEAVIAKLNIDALLCLFPVVFAAWDVPGGAAGLRDVPTPGPLPAPAEGKQGSTWVPEGHENQGH